MLGFHGRARAQEHEVAGQVTADDGGVLPGVNIVVKGTTLGTTTDVEGRYTIGAPSPQDTLVFSYVGFVTREEPINGRSTIDVTLTPDTEMLGEVVVVGYGTQGRESVTAAISKVTGDQVAEAPVPDAAEALQGRTPGVTVAGDAPGEAPQVRIRGLTTPNNNSPLFVVDGVPVGNTLGVNANNIESVEVLKDASAASIYGSRAAGGVVLVTTKRGSQREGIHTEFSSYVGVQQAWKEVDLMNTQQYVNAWTDIYQRSGDPVPPRLEQLGSGAPSYDYQDLLFRTAPTMNYDLAFSGGGESAQYRISLGYLSQEGTIVNSGFDRYSLAVNTDFQIDRFRVGESLSVVHMERDNVRTAGGRSILEHLTKFAPYLQPRDPDNPGGFNGPDQIDNNDAENPIRIQELGTDQRNETRMTGNVYGELDLIEGLTLRSVLGMETYFSNDYAFTPSFSDGEFHGLENAELSEVRTTFFSPITTTTLTYDQSFGAHSVNAVGGFEAWFALSRSAGAQGVNSLSNELKLPGTVEDDIAVGSRTRDVMLSSFGRLTYNYDGRYIIQGSIRRDGYSRFGQENRFGIFPSISVGWNVAEEAFMEGSPFDMLKLRGSWGEVGNNNAVGAYETQATVNTNYFYVDAEGNIVSAATIPALSNQALKWETTQMTNVGFDFAILDNALDFTAEYYRNTTQDVLLTVPLPGSFGFIVDPRFNTGDVQTDGFEFSLGYRGDSGGFGWDFTVNFGTASNEVTRLGLGSPINGAHYGGPSHDITRVEEGEPLYFFFGHKVDRLYQESDFTNGELNDDLPQPAEDVQPGDIKFKDVDGDGDVDTEDRTNIGNPMPDYTYGLNATLHWKNVDLSAFLQGAGGHQIYRAWAFWSEGMTRIFNGETTILNRWTPENTDTDVPRGVVGDPAGNTRPSERWVEDGDYLRLKLVTLGYTIPSRLTGGIQNLRLYVQSRNLLTFTGYDGYDPEVGVWSDNPGDFTSDFGVDFGQMPQPRTFTFGVQLGF